MGSSVAFNLLQRRVATEVVLIDRRANMVASHVLDLEQTLVLGAGGAVRAGTPAELADLDVVVVCASAPQRMNTSRMVFLAENAAVVGGVLEHLPPDWPGIVFMVTNPVDPLVTLAVQRHGLDRRRVLGYTLNDSLRLRTGIARELGVDPASVEAWVLGEHGDATVPLLHRVRIDGRPVRLDPQVARAAVEFQRNWYREHVALDSGRSSTWTSGIGIARMIEAIAQDDPAPWPVSMVLDGEYGLAGAAVSVPVQLGPAGAETVLEWPLSELESAGLAAAHDLVADAAQSCVT